MKSESIFTLALVAFFCLSVVWIPADCTASESILPISVNSSGIKWYSYEEGIERGKEEKKNVFLNFYTQWCGYCKKMDKETFANSSIIAYLNENFISIKVNSDKERQIANYYYVNGLPTSWFLSKEGSKISSLPGYIPSDMLINILKYIHTDSYKKMNFRKFMKK